MNRTNLARILAGTSLLFFLAPAYSQQAGDIPGVCLINNRGVDSRCRCLNDRGLFVNIDRYGDSGIVCGLFGPDRSANRSVASGSGAIEPIPATGIPNVVGNSARGRLGSGATEATRGVAGRTRGNDDIVTGSIGRGGTVGVGSGGAPVRADNGANSGKIGNTGNSNSGNNGKGGNTGSSGSNGSGNNGSTGNSGNGTSNNGNSNGGNNGNSGSGGNNGETRGNPGNSKEVGRSGEGPPGGRETEFNFTNRDGDPTKDTTGETGATLTADTGAAVTADTGGTRGRSDGDKGDRGGGNGNDNKGGKH